MTPSILQPLITADQRLWTGAKTHRVRVIRKSRQVGATWCFVREALIDAAETGRNQIFVLPSLDHARETARLLHDAPAPMELFFGGRALKMSNGAQVGFFGPHAPPIDGNVYVDEFAWVGAEALTRLMAALEDSPFRQTFYSYWTDPKDVRCCVPKALWPTGSHPARLAGEVGDDGVWRHDGASSLPIGWNR